ncbi:MAG: DNA methyltransferase [Nitrososphaerales archaeon]
MRFIFVLSDGSLSFLEIEQYLRGRGIQFTVTTSTDRFAILEIPSVKTKELLNLGGIFKVGEISTEGDRLTEVVANAEIGWLPSKLRWSVSYYSIPGIKDELIRETEGILAEKLKAGGAVRARRIQQDISEQGLIEVSSKRLDNDMFDVLLAKGGNKYYQGRTITNIPSDSFRERDLDRPFQESTISMPPRLARILVNLLSLPSGKKVLDPFCGTGTILMEALTLGMNVSGVDSNLERINGTKENLYWLANMKRLSSESFGRRIKKGDARKLAGINEESIDGIATEPILIPRLTKYPDQRSGHEMIEKSRKIYLDSLVAMQRVLRQKGTISIVTPYLRIAGQQTITFNFRNLVGEAGLRVSDEFVRFPLFPRHAKEAKVLRAFWLLKKD